MQNSVTLDVAHSVVKDQIILRQLMLQAPHLCQAALPQASGPTADWRCPAGLLQAEAKRVTKRLALLQSRRAVRQRIHDHIQHDAVSLADTAADVSPLRCTISSEWQAPASRLAVSLELSTAIS